MGKDGQVAPAAARRLFGFTLDCGPRATKWPLEFSLSAACSYPSTPPIHPLTG